MEIGKKIRWVRSCLSTNDLAKKMARTGEEEGTVVVAEEQTEGRGTRGRKWYSPKNKGLYTSVILRPPTPSVSLLPVVGGLAVKDAVFHALGVRLCLKWPNDLIGEGRKVGGILCESGFLGNRLHYVIMGIGLNLSHEKKDFPPEIRGQAISLKLIKKEPIRMDEILPSLWTSLEHWYSLFLKGEEKKVIKAFQAGSVLPLHRRITVLTDQGIFRGVFQGIDTSGNLILEENGKKLKFFSAQIETIESA
ncbi:MAG: biotin--[acetyl-CoA-carboxylase] ligase [Candidatus Aminicenantes bacterium]